jgi:ABC-type iron transport system FetAB ATPase subunit
MLQVSELVYRGTGPFSFEVGTGECVGLSGPSGSGKTLLLRALCDLDTSEGQVSLNGVDVNAVSAHEWRRKVGFLPADSHWWHDTVGEHFRDAAIEQRLDALGFAADVLSWSVERLSSGERQRLALLRLLTGSPEALLLDEPTTHLDDDNRGYVESAVESYRSAENVPVLWVAHDRAQLHRVCSRAFRISDGKLEEEPAWN